MALGHISQSIGIDRSELTMLRTTLERWCQDNRIELSASKAETAAIELMDWYQFGMTHPDRLIELLRGCDLTERAKPANLYR